MKFEESVDGKLRMTVRVSFRVTIDDLIEICLRDEKAKKSKKVLIESLCDGLKTSGRELALDSVFMYLTMDGNPTQMYDVANSEDIEKCKQIVLNFFPELKEGVT